MKPFCIRCRIEQKNKYTDAVGNPGLRSEKRGIQIQDAGREEACDVELE